jgi:toxin ParE1/3/4
MAHRLSPEAEAELDDIWWYIVQGSGSVDVAKRVVAPITERFHLLAAFPHLGRARDDLHPGLRGFTVGDYLIIYKLEREDVLILHVVHGRRDIEALLD